MKMNYARRSRKLLFVATALAIIGLAAVLTFYAAVLGAFNRNALTINNVILGFISYNTNGGSTGNANHSVFNVSNFLSTKFELGSTSYIGPTAETFQLQKDISRTWTNHGSASSPSVVVTGLTQTIYGSADGSSTNNHNFVAEIST